MGVIMEIVNMSKENIESLKVLPLKIYNSGGDLLLFRYNNILRVLKMLNNISIEKYQDHIAIIKLLDEYREFMPKGFVLPEFFVTEDDIIKYFAINYVSGRNLSVILRDRKVSIDDKKYYLKEIGNILHQMKDIRKNAELSNFYLGDLHEDNFMVDRQGILRTIDLDGGKFIGNKSPISKYLSGFSLISDCNISKYKFEMENPYFCSYMVDENTDIYCYIIIILNYLCNGNINNMGINQFYQFINYLNDIGVDKELLNCFERIITDGDNINPYDYIDTLTSNQIKKARTFL